MRDKMYDGFYKYDKSVAQNYDRDREHEEHWSKEWDFVKEYFESHNPSPILDVPVGTGRFLPVYPRLAQVYGVDISNEMLAMAATRVEDQQIKEVHLQEGSIFSLNFQDNYFDCSVCWRLAHLLPEQLLKQAVAELYRVTKGEVLIQAYVRGSFWPRLMSRLKRLPMNLARRLSRKKENPWAHIKAHFHSEEVFLKIFKECNFVIKKKIKLCNYYGHEIYVFILGRS